MKPGEVVYSYELMCENQMNIEIDEEFLYVIIEGECACLKYQLNSEEEEEILRFSKGEVFGTLNQIKRSENPILRKDSIESLNALVPTIKIITKCTSKFLRLGKKQQENFNIKARLDNHQSNSIDYKPDHGSIFHSPDKVMKENKMLALDNSSSFDSQFQPKKQASFNKKSKFLCHTIAEGNYYGDTIIKINSLLLSSSSITRAESSRETFFKDKINQKAIEDLNINTKDKSIEMDISNINKILRSKESFRSLKDAKEICSVFAGAFISSYIRIRENLMQNWFLQTIDKLNQEDKDNPNYFHSELKQFVGTDEFNETMKEKLKAKFEFAEKKEKRLKNDELIQTNRKKIKEEDSFFEKTVYCIKCQVQPRNVIAACNHLLYCDDCAKDIQYCSKCGKSLNGFLKLFRS